MNDIVLKLAYLANEPSIEGVQLYVDLLVDTDQRGGRTATQILQSSLLQDIPDYIKDRAVNIAKCTTMHSNFQKREKRTLESNPKSENDF